MNDTLKQAIDKIVDKNRRAQIENSVKWCRESLQINGVSNSITVSNIITMEDALAHARNKAITDREFRALRMYFLKRALGGDEE